MSIQCSQLSIVVRARSFLFVPANQPERVFKALATATDCVIVDLEDAVAPGSKQVAREQLAQTLQQCGAQQLKNMLVRVNAVGTPWHEADIALLRHWMNTGLATMLPKAECAASLREVAKNLGPDTQLVALIESLAGLDAANALASDAQVARLAFGHLDFQLDLGMQASAQEPELAFARNAVVCASRRAGLPAPIDGVTVDTGNADRLISDASRARAFGFGAKLCIHPSQILHVNEAFGYTDAERDWATKVLEGAAKHAGETFSLDGRMVDLPVIRAAQAALRT
ncbi:CoA ester lyase [Diaphorobacter sp. HDW4A]|uniref:HpcH/HpaI aldolase/citrate lyase family protein n=1 Tax=Diaphorobacter sp. HDW4A TaxID=2714924 RepID=UPI001409CC99|nr:CoA ester lyase [Diaphorobacter sp. HDW4A]QIL79958.1 CoA ester lyase [Diaphorobacter sp. HDW4A]